MNKLGFGFLRLPRDGAGEIDWPLLNRLTDTFLARGGKYFDTAYTYLDGKSEAAIRRCLVERHPRDSFLLADKLPGWKVKDRSDCRRYFDEQLARCGVENFDVYLLHWLNPENYAVAQQFDEFGFLKTLKEEGRAARIGFSYHGDAGLLEQILTEHPETEVVQLQINYLDWDNPALQAGKCYEVAQRFGKDVVVMEPVKGGTLANLPDEAMALMRKEAPERSAASWAMRFAQSLPAVSVVLSGMNAIDQLEDNLRDVPPITEEEKAVLREVCGILSRSIAIPCTACRYCESGCPRGIAIPDYFRLYNEYSRSPDEGWKMQPVYESIAKTRGRASECVECRACEASCPQKIAITDWLRKVEGAFEG